MLHTDRKHQNTIVRFDKSRQDLAKQTRRMISELLMDLMRVRTERDELKLELARIRALKWGTN